MHKTTMTLLFGLFVFTGLSALRGGDLAEEFRNPPDSARPWVYCFWLEGNVTREGITTDLEAMKRAGVGGLLFMDGGMGNPLGPHRFMSDSWREMFKHMVAEANRLGLEINLNDDPGWAGSGGPWITPELAAQKIVISETLVEGPIDYDAALPQPPTVQNFYRDIAVLACPAPEKDAGGNFRRIENFNTSKTFCGDRDFAACVPWPRTIPTNPSWPAVPAAQCVASDKIQTLTANMDASGRLKWKVPDGRWLILRIGHTLAGGVTRSAQPEGLGLECDKLSKAAIETQFKSMVGKLLDDVGPLAGKTIVSTHIDSWEAGSGNWTDGFREEFRRRRGYDMLPYMPAIGGLVVDDLEVSERFLWDLRETVCEMLLENYAGRMKELAKQRGLRLSIEGYDGTSDDLRLIGTASEPMCEFWQRGCYTGMPLCDVVDEVASAAHVYGRKIVSAEAFSNWRGDFLDHPATLKRLGDWAFCSGVNRFCYSEWIMQPWPDRVPGVSFLHIGTVFHRSLSWWEQSKPWNEYVARCQHMLRQGSPIADVCFMQAEGAPQRFVAPIPVAECGAIPDRPPYNYDGCPADLVLREMKVEDGFVALPSGMRYRLLVLPSYNADGRPVMRVEGNYVYTPGPIPKVETMTPQLLRKIKELVEAGATVLGTRPRKSPSLVDFPKCDHEVEALADELWGKDAGIDGKGEHRLGKGRLIWGSTPDVVIYRTDVPSDFCCSLGSRKKLNYAHRRAEDGTDIYFVANGTDRVVQGEYLFRANAGTPEFWRPQTGSIERTAEFMPTGGCTRVSLQLEPYESTFVVFRPGKDDFDPVILSFWEGKQINFHKTISPKIVVQKATYGIPGDPARTRDVTAKVQSIVNGGELRFAAWRLGEGDDPGFTTANTLAVEYTFDGQPRKAEVLDGQTICFGNAIDPPPTAELHRTGDGKLLLEAWQNGQYKFHTESGKKLKCTVENLPAAKTIDGPWELSFPLDSGAPQSISLGKLISWSDHSEAGVKYFSGTATYRKRFDLPPDALAAGRKLYLDLGQVAVIAQVTVNSRDLGILWKAPFRVDATDALRAGENVLEIRVTNLPVNRLIGDEQLPDDSDRDPSGMLKSWPDWLQQGKPSPTGRRTFATFRVWKKDSPLQESGLLGPVKLYSTELATPK
jgi:hypothetical protein